MASIKLSRKEFEKRIKITKEIENKIAMMGTPLESLTGSEVEVDVTANRPDLLSTQGYLRAFEAFIEKKGAVGLKNYKIKKSNYKLEVKKTLPKQWPYALACVVKGLKLNEEKIKDIIQLQEKLGSTLLRGRRKGGLGLYPLNKIKFPLTFEGRKRQEIIFRPLEMNDWIAADKILEMHPTGKKYGHICEGWEVMPVFVDNEGKGNIMSMPPIINSHDLGRVEEKTTEVFVEVTGNEMEILQKSLIIMTTMLADMGGTIYEVECTQQDGKKTKQPILEPSRMKLRRATIKEVLGIDLDEKEIKKLLARMGHDYEEKNKIVSSPAWRVDLMHEHDLVEEVAIAYGYENFKPEIPQNDSTVGEESKKSKFCKKIAETLAGLGMQEVMSYYLLREQDLKKIGAKSELEVSDSKTEYKYLRPALRPGILRIMSENIDSEYPQKIFEIGTIFRRNNKKETSVSEITKLALAISPGNFTESRQIIDYLLRMIGVNYEVEQTKKKGTINGRCAKIMVEGKPCGYVGEVHPALLKSLKMKTSLVIAEISLKPLYDSLNNKR
jgi:phenylalanyl-tRNA synthetase beta chain